ncbi:antibiotic biosynthesis monooxygenase family protein [Curvivirga sp.]|uniref:antibiotic biosynthesis monooxygenase family protein n=1 Tax=Curvivirga sp. TaxID=2856848 RepID=UPI003B5BE8F3
MIAVIFEVHPKSERKQEYLDIAAILKEELVKVEGFISVERFQSLTNPDKILSLSFFENETAVKKWRELKSHRAAQQSGRNGIFEDYRLRVASVIRDYGMEDRDEVPK